MEERGGKEVTGYIGESEAEDAPLPFPYLEAEITFPDVGPCGEETFGLKTRESLSIRGRGSESSSGPVPLKEEETPTQGWGVNCFA